MKNTKQRTGDFCECKSSGSERGFAESQRSAGRGRQAARDCYQPAPTLEKRLTLSEPALRKFASLPESLQMLALGYAQGAEAARKLNAKNSAQSA